MKFFSDLVTNKKAWQLLAISALGFELIALYFQYVMGLEPCIMCIYQRVAILAIFFAGLIGIFARQYVIARLLSYGLWGTGAIWGLIIALEHVEKQTSKFSFLFSCEFVPNFPDWAPLHEWIPTLFAATGDCGKINWEFLDYSMPQWMIAIYGTYTVLFGLVIVSRLYKTKML